MTKIDVNSLAVGVALRILKETIDSADEGKLKSLQFDGNGSYAKRLERAFEIEYNCNVISEDRFGLIGYITFVEEKYATAFVLRFGANDSPKKVFNDL